ncbi:Polyketide synthase HetM [Cercospora beticola]|uniref:Polyketide synthase HetM n=1 Tax=Cercospora beticola TaxID=122368 RepID=A0A2G5HK61_CERBT|nr:Polyketide synthase HetM [Cercospora beticola]PIA92957.1 Polyketide synthase HetM [Cercospora beticola]WPB02100.1 hypothetical protein RHO25_006734 [Cercospora beticola]
MAAQVLKQPQIHQSTSKSAVSISNEEIKAPVLEDATPRTVDELIKLRTLQKGSDDPIISYPNEGTQYIDYSIKDIDHLIEQAACVYATTVKQRLKSSDPVQTIAFLGDSDLGYLISFLAISRLGHTALLLSTRITGEACEHLINSCKATTLIIHPSYAPAAASIKANIPALKLANILDSRTLQGQSARLPQAYLDLDQETHNQSFIIHSSGSTGLPKPIFQTHKASLYTYSGSFGLVGHITLPLYHNHGIACTFRGVYARKKIYLYNARLPLASQHLLATLREHPDIKILYGVPYALKLLAETEEGCRLLSRLDIVMFGGSACPKPVGDSLVANGVRLVGHYGATEVGQLMTSFRDFDNDKQWDWLRVPEYLLQFLSMEERGPGLWELCVKKGWPSKVATNRDDGSYATKDLFEKHPTMENTWRYYARLDDTIVLENGEKANPLLVEGILRHNRNVAEAIVFGAGKSQLGAFIIRKTESDLSDEDIINSVMPAIEEGNLSLPAYGQLSRDVVRVLPADTEYRKTDKGTVIRAAFYRDFAKQIDDMYVEEAKGSLKLERQELLALLRKEVTSRLRIEVNFEDDTDLFSLGIDSLQSIQIRSVIVKTLDLGGAELGRNFVFDFPTLEQMANELLRLQSGESQTQKISIEDQMAALVEEYSSFETHKPVQREWDGDYIVVTGATGSLGAHVVSRLANKDTVRKIYCLVRASSLSAAQTRVQESLQARQLHNTISSQTWQERIVCLPSDFSSTTLGLTEEQYTSIASDVTHTLHLAWSVNFNKNLQSFSADCLGGVQNLINLCLKSQRPQPATFNYCSSVSATVRTPGGFVPETLPESYACAQGMGYAQSKLVAENICDRAAKAAGIKARVLRVGQVIGDTERGIWNSTEAIPMIFQTAKTVGVLPALDERPAWLPVDTVAQGFIDISLATSEEPSGSASFTNIVNPKTVHWTEDLLPLLKEAGVEFEAVGQREWIKRLRESEPDPEKNPPIKLVDFFAGKYDTEAKRPGLEYSTENARTLSPALKEAGVVDRNLVEKFVKYLKSVGSL